jgi:hypothetical protein
MKKRSEREEERERAESGEGGRAKSEMVGLQISRELWSSTEAIGDPSTASPDNYP